MLVANQNASVPPVDVVAVAIGIRTNVRAAIGIAGIGSSGVGCTITVSPPAITMAEASGTAVADRYRASLDRTCNRGSVTTAGTDAAKRPEIAARTSAGAQPRSRTAEAGTGRTARPHGRHLRTPEDRRPRSAEGRPASWEATGKLRKHRSRRQGNRGERHADRQRQVYLPGHYSLRFRFASRGPVPTRPARGSDSTNGCRAPGQRPLGLAGHRREQGGSGTTPRRAPAGTRASAACRR